MVRVRFHTASTDYGHFNRQARARLARTLGAEKRTRTDYRELRRRMVYYHHLRVDSSSLTAAGAFQLLLPGLQLFFGIERQLDHALEQLLRRNAGEVPEHELLHVEAHEITQLQCATLAREHKVTMPTVNDDQVALGIEPRPPHLAGRSLEGVSGKPARSSYRRSHGSFEACANR